VRTAYWRWHKARAVKHGNESHLERQGAVSDCFSSSSLFVSPCCIRDSGSTARAWSDSTEVCRILEYSLLIYRRRNLSNYHSGAMVKDKSDGWPIQAIFWLEWGRCPGALLLGVEDKGKRIARLYPGVGVPTQAKKRLEWATRQHFGGYRPTTGSSTVMRVPLPGVLSAAMVPP
jgi:hypothetical protein